MNAQELLGCRSLRDSGLMDHEGTHHYKCHFSELSVRNSTVTVDICSFLANARNVTRPKILLARQRHDAILDSIQTEGSARVIDLAELLGVSEMTVRRDLTTLAQRNLVDKVHGGATRAGGNSTNEPGFGVKRLHQRREKQAIAEAAAAMVRPGIAIALGAGTTTWTLAKLLSVVHDLTVITNSPSIAQIFYDADRSDQIVILTGGRRTPSDALVGPIATRAIENLHVDLAFMGVHGMADGLGFSTPNLLEAEINQSIMQCAQRVAVLADHTKWGIRGLAKIASLDEANTVISDDRLPAAAKERFRGFADTELVLASTDEADS